MIALVTSIYSTSLNNRHGPKILFFPGLVRQPCILPSDLQTGMPQKLLQHLKTQPGVEQFTGIRVPQAVYGISLVGQLSVVR